MLIENTEYEILTPSGWKDFRGLTKTENKLTYRITLDDGTIVDATAEHQFFSNNVKVELRHLNPGDVIDTVEGAKTVSSITPNKNTAVFDVIEVTDEHHQFIVNKCIITKNCDEMSFVQPNIATAFWSSISPTLATGGRAIVTSTPNSDEDMFATIWKESQDKTDEFGNAREDGLGRNGFFGFRSYWYEHPERDEVWKQRELNKIGEENFRREFECCAYDTKIVVRDQFKTFDTTLGELFDLILTNKINYDDKTLADNTLGLQVLTDSGFRPFSGVAHMGTQPIIEIGLNTSETIKCTYNHKIYVNPLHYVYAHQLEPGDQLIAINGVCEVTSIFERNQVEAVFDLIEVANGHRYWTNGLLSSNCEFLVYDETLISSIKLAELYGREPIMKLGQSRWYSRPTPGHVYLVALDPSMGTGGDNAAIQVFELPEFVQVAEWHHNITSIPGQVKVLKEILTYIQTELGEQASNNIYWSCENNTVGEAALVVINDLGEESFPGYFISEPVRKGRVRKFRKGFNTTFGTKISACSRLKFLIEENRMKLNSYSLISELKAFIATGTSFRAKSGHMDDLISSLLLIVRMSVVLSDWDPRILESLSIDATDEDWVAPMPIFISLNY